MENAEDEEEKEEITKPAVPGPAARVAVVPTAHKVRLAGLLTAKPGAAVEATLPILECSEAWEAASTLP
jgi:hypothetical protein